MNCLLTLHFSLLHVPPSYLCHAYVCSCSQLIYFVLDPHFSVHCCGFILVFICQQTASLTLTCWHYCQYLNDSTASLLLFLVPIIVVISHGFWCFFGNFLMHIIILCLSGATLLFGFISLFSHFSIVFYSMSSLSICMHCLLYI